MPETANDTLITDLPNLGPQTAKWLKKVGIKTKKDLEKVTHVKAYLMVKLSDRTVGPSPICTLNSRSGTRRSGIANLAPRIPSHPSRRALPRRRVKDAGLNANIIFLYAMVAALLDVHWSEIPEEMKEVLKKQVQ